MINYQLNYLQGQIPSDDLERNEKDQNIIVWGTEMVPMGYGFCILVVIENCNHHLFCVPLVGAHIMIIIMHRPIGDY